MARTRRAEYDATQAAKRLKVSAAAFRWARHTGLIPAPDAVPLAVVAGHCRGDGRRRDPGRDAFTADLRQCGC